MLSIIIRTHVSGWGTGMLFAGRGIADKQELELGSRSGL